jgi:hypothetical protein
MEGLKRYQLSSDQKALDGDPDMILGFYPPPATETLTPQQISEG